MDQSRNANAVGRYEVGCWSCKQPFDALEATWCGCLSKERSLVCPTCLKCFCAAPRPYKQKFWGDAPQAMWDRKIAEHRKEALPPNGPAAEVEHPLVLIVDDEPEVQAVAIRAVETLGYSWVLAHDGEEGVRLSREYRPELILTDAMMPKLDGREMTKAIKQRDGDSAPKIIVMTSLYTAAQYKYEALREFQVDDYAAKPLDFLKLKELLEKHLG